MSVSIAWSKDAAVQSTPPAETRRIPRAIAPDAAAAPCGSIILTYTPCGSSGTISSSTRPRGFSTVTVTASETSTALCATNPRGERAVCALGAKPSAPIAQQSATKAARAAIIDCCT